MNPREDLAIYRDLSPAELAACLEADEVGAERLAAYQAMDKRITSLPRPEPEWWLRTAFHQTLKNHSTPQFTFANLSVTTGQLTAVLVLGLLILAAWLLLSQQSENTLLTPFNCSISPTEQINFGGGTIAGEFPVWMTSQGQQQGVTRLSTASGKPEQVSEARWSREILLVDENVEGDLLITGEQLDGPGQVFFIVGVEADGETRIWEPQQVITDAHTSTINGRVLGRVQHIIAWGVTNPGCYQLTFRLNEYTVPIVVEVIDTPTPTPLQTADPTPDLPQLTLTPTPSGIPTCPISPTEEIWAGTGPMAGEFPVWMTSRGSQPTVLLSNDDGILEQISEGSRNKALLIVDEQFPDPLVITGRQLDGEGAVYFFQEDNDRWDSQLVIPKANISDIDIEPKAADQVVHIISWGVTEPGCYELTFSLAEYAPKIVIDVLPSPLITPTPTPDPQRVQLRLDSWSPWSPGGQTLAYWQHTAVDLQRSHIPPGQLTFYNTSAGVTCSLPTAFGYDGGGGTHHRYAWRSDGNFLLFKGRDLLVLPDPCHESHTTAAGFFPEPIQEVVAVHRFQAFYLLRGQNQYWLYQPFADGNLQLLPIESVTPHSFNAYAISPQGRYVGINLTGGGTAVIEVASGEVKSTVDWSHLTNVDMLPPVWLNEDTYLIQWTTADQGPLLITLEGDMQPVAELFGLPTSPQQMAWGVPTSPQAYAILFQDFSEGGNRDQVWLYHSTTGEVETLAFTSGEFDPNGRWLFLRQVQENTVDTLYASNSVVTHHELWWREIEAVGSLALPLASDDEFIHWTTGAGQSDLVRVSNQLTVSVGNRVLIVSEMGDIQEEIVENNITGTPLRSPDGGHLAIVIRSEETGPDELVVLPIE